jgi:hypothetical protein
MIIKIFKKLKSLRKWGVIALFASYLLYFGVYANIRSRVWQDSETMKEAIWKSEELKTKKYEL